MPSVEWLAAVPMEPNNLPINAVHCLLPVVLVAAGAWLGGRIVLPIARQVRNMGNIRNGSAVAGYACYAWYGLVS